MQRMRWLCVVVVLALVSALPALAQGGVATEKLIYQGAEVETQVDVNGVAATQLVGGAIDAIAAQAQEAAKMMQASGARPLEGKAAMLPALLPMIEPAKEVIKSLDRITVLVMNPKQEANGSEFISYYTGLMTAEGWSPLVTVRDKDRTAVVMMMAPEAKGVFFAVNDRKEMVAGLVTTTKPMGDLLGQLISSGRGALPMIMSQLQRSQSVPKRPAASAKPAPAKAPRRH